MLSLLLAIPTIVLFLVLVITYNSVASYKNGMLFAVTLPAKALEHQDIQRIQAQYKTQFKRVWVSMLLAYLPFIALYKWPAIQTIYYLLWMCTFVIIVVFPFRKAFRATLELKRQEDWFVGKKHVIQADLRTAQLKNKRTAPLGLFAIPLALGALLTWWVGTKDTQLYSLGIGAIGISLLFLGITLLIRRSKSTVYSENSDINIALNQSKRRSLSYLFFSLALLENVHFYIIAMLVMNDNEAMSTLWLMSTILFSIVPILLIVSVYSKLRSVQRDMLELGGQTIYSDDDEYWANGFTYHNPYDKSLMVPKRVGIGETINTGTMAGKMIMGGAAGLIIAVIIGVSFMLIRSELTSPAMTITSAHEIAIDYPMYSFTFAVNEIEEATLVNEFPSGMKSNGEATNKYARGHFRLKDIGKTRLYVFKNNPPYIRLKLSDEYVFYNDIDPVVTKQLFQQIEQAIEAAK